MGKGKRRHVLPAPKGATRSAQTLPLTQETVAALTHRRDLAALREIADAAHRAHRPEVALAALEALDRLGEPQRDILVKKQGQILMQYGQCDRAARLMAEYLAAGHEDDDEARRILADALYRIKRHRLALAHLRVLVERKPGDRHLRRILAIWTEEAGDRQTAEALFRQLIAEEGADCLDSKVFWPLVALERCPATAAEHDAMIPRFLQHLEQAQGWVAGWPAAKRRAAMRDVGIQAPFALAYWPGDITPALRAWGQWIASLLPPQAPPQPPRRERVRLALFSSHLARSSVWFILLRGLVKNLDRRFFELTVMNHGQRQDDQTEWCRQQADRYYGRRPSKAWLELLREEAPDVLCYPDTAMDSMNVGLAARRLAPLQVTTWGHPVSSGLATVDLYFSGEALEPEDAPAHYVERLVRLPGVGACTPNNHSTRHALPPELEALFADGRPVALIPAYGFKLAPANDALWIALARRYPELRLVLFKQSEFDGTGVKSQERIVSAFAAAGLDPDRHLALIEQQPMGVFLTLLERAALYLDVPSFSGYTTAWHAVFVGIPIVTLKGRFLRQRLAAGLLETIGTADTVVEDQDSYLAKVGELLIEWRHAPAQHAARRQKMRERAPLACNDLRVVRAMERAILEELAVRGNATAAALLPKHRESYPGYDYRAAEHRVVAPARAAGVAPKVGAGGTARAASAATAAPHSTTTVSGVKPMPSSTNSFAPQPVLGLTPAAGTPSPAAPPLPPWRLLEQDLHLTTLSHSYAPVGLLEMIPSAPQAVFDLGCFVGGTGKWLKQKFPGVRVVGVELLEKAAEQARAVYDEVFAGRFEDFPVERHAGAFDVIIAADVLEHLYNPWAALERLKSLLAPGGALYVSLPNIRNLRVLEALAAAGEWRYEGAGILDITHLRFFTRQSAIRMLTETGWQALETRANLDPALRGMIEGKNLAAVRNIELSKLALRNLQEQESVEFFTLQWFFRCQPI